MLAKGIEVAMAIARRDAWRKDNVFEAAASPTATTSSVADAATSAARESRRIESVPKARNPKPNFRSHDFPSLKDSSHLKQRKMKYGPPFDTHDWNFKYSARWKDFPFDQVADGAVKLKLMPIRLEWGTNQQSSSVAEMEGSFES